MLLSSIKEIKNGRLISDEFENIFNSEDASKVREQYLLKLKELEKQLDKSEKENNTAMAKEFKQRIEQLKRLWEGVEKDTKDGDIEQFLKAIKADTEKEGIAPASASHYLQAAIRQGYSKEDAIKLYTLWKHPKGNMDACIAYDKESWEMTRREYTGEKPSNPFGQEMNRYQARFAIHGYDVEAAIEAGKKVPDNVLKDYPKLKKVQR